uniref:SP40.9 n=1 Tax=Bemisia tabaci TaxID=7038 RepID=A0A7S5HG73_BEMTA|nr:SP40.9 [Bemisia tabaci]
MRPELGDMILQQLDKTNEELASSADRRKDQVPKFLEKVNSWAQTLDDMLQMKQSLNRSLTFAEGKINAAYKEAKDKLCGHHKTVKGYLELFPPADPEVAKLITSYGKKGTQQGLVVKKFDELLNQLQGLLARYGRHKSPEESEDPTTLDKWKAYFMRKSREAQATFSIEIDNIKESARSVLEALSNAIIISNNLKTAPKGGLELKNSKDKAAFLRMVSQLDTKLGCSGNQKK